MKKFILAAALLCLIAFAIPIEHKYDKLFRFFSLTLIPEGLKFSAGYEKKIYFYASDLIALILCFTGLFWFRIPLKRFFGHPLWIVFLCALGSIIASPFAHYPVAYTRLLQLLTPILLFSFTSFAFSEKERPAVVRLLFFTIVAAALFQSVIGIAQYFREAPLGLRLLGETNSLSTIEVTGGARWTLDAFFSHNTWPIKMRAAGTMPHANVFGGFLTLSLLATYALFMQAKKGKVLLGLLIPLQFFAMSLSYSRSAFFAWCIGTAIWFGMTRFKRELKVGSLGVIIAISVALSGALLHEQILCRGGIVNYNATAKSSDAVRIYHQNLALEIIKSKPLLGLGYGQFSERAQDYISPHEDAYTRSTAPHNIYLFLACETGLISLGAFLIFILLMLWRAVHTPITIETATLTAIFIAFLFIGCCDFYPILFQQGKLMFFTFSGLLACSLATHVEKVVKLAAD